ncbi:MAG: DNA-binding protein [Salinibacter sp.]
MPASPPRPDAPSSTLPAPQPTHPVAGRAITADAPEFRWTAVPDAAGYRLQLAASSDFETCYYDERVDGPTAVPLAEVLPPGAETVVWRVRAETSGEAPWCNAASFRVAASDEVDAAAQFLVDAPPVPIRPVQGDAVDAEAATFTWEGVPEASGYRVQVSPSPAFDASIVDLTLDQTTTLTLFGELPQQTEVLHWRVRALFPNDTEGPWSEIGTFGTDPDVESAMPVVAEPQADDGPEAPGEPAPSADRSAVAAGPARTARTSSTAALVAIGVLVVSFLLTILLVVLEV